MPEKLPPIEPASYGPDLQIVPVSDTEVDENETIGKRQLIYDILNKPDVKLPWVQPSKKIERGQA